jgi:hypothetical protein
MFDFKKLIEMNSQYILETNHTDDSESELSESNNAIVYLKNFLEFKLKILIILFR